MSEGFISFVWDDNGDNDNIRDNKDIAAKYPTQSIRLKLDNVQLGSVCFVFVWSVRDFAPQYVSADRAGRPDLQRCSLPVPPGSSSHTWM